VRFVLLNGVDLANWGAAVLRPYLLALDYLWDAEVRRLGIGRLLQDFCGYGAWDDYVVTQRGVGGLIVGEDLSHGLNVGGVEFVELANVFEDIIDLIAIRFQFGFAEIEIGQIRYSYYVFSGDLHLWFLLAPEIRQLLLASLKTGHYNDPDNILSGGDFGGLALIFFGDVGVD
jgi:hypothetical protein